MQTYPLWREFPSMVCKRSSWWFYRDLSFTPIIKDPILMIRTAKTAPGTVVHVHSYLFPSRSERLVRKTPSCWRIRGITSTPSFSKTVKNYHCKTSKYSQHWALKLPRLKSFTWYISFPPCGQEHKMQATLTPGKARFPCESEELVVYNAQ